MKTFESKQYHIINQNFIHVTPTRNQRCSSTASFLSTKNVEFFISISICIVVIFDFLFNSYYIETNRYVLL